MRKGAPAARPVAEPEAEPPPRAAVVSVADGSRLAAVLARAAAQGASDIVLTEGSPPVGAHAMANCRPQPGPVVESAELLAFFQPLLGERAPIFQRTGSVDLAITAGRRQRR